MTIGDVPKGFFEHAPVRTVNGSQTYLGQRKEPLLIIGGPLSGHFFVREWKDGPIATFANTKEFFGYTPGVSHAN